MEGEIAVRPAWTVPSWSQAGNAGRPDNATLTFTEPLRVRMRSTSWITSDGRCSRPTRSRYVVFGWALDTTCAALITEPSSSSTPIARPAVPTTIRATRAAVRISAPAARAAPAIAADTPPMPPSTHPQAPKWPSTCPIQWCISTYADPGVIGPPHAPTTACVASAPFTRGSSNHSSSRSAALIVNSRTSSWMSRPVHPRSLALARAQPRTSVIRMFGGTTNNNRRSSPPTCSKERSNAT